ncbi:MAG: helix-turn-helix domain-containing protein [Flavobacteriaceae bacterium]
MSENQQSKGEVDLFGAPLTQIRERWGRPSFAKSKENQELVALLRAAGWNQSRIARYLGCDEKTLRKHFSRELEQGCDIIEAMGLQVLLKKVREGNAPSVNRLLDLVENKGNPAPPAPLKPAAAAAERLGKKASADLAAVDAHRDTGWGSILQ